MHCPNVASPQWKSLVEKIGETNAWREFFKFGSIPSADEYTSTDDGVFRSIRTKSTEEIAAGIDPAFVKNQKDIKYIQFVKSLVINKLGDISPNKKLTTSPVDAFNATRKNFVDAYRNVTDFLKVVNSPESFNSLKTKDAQKFNDLLAKFYLTNINSFDEVMQAGAQYQYVLDNFNTYAEYVVADMARQGIRMSGSKVEQIDPKDKEDQEQDDNDDIALANNELGERYDRSIFETNPRDTASIRIKALVQTIKTGEYELGIPTYANPEDVFSDILYAGAEINLSGFTAADSKLNAFRFALQKRAEARPYLNDLITKINTFEQQGQWEKINDLLTFASKAFANETLLLYKTRKDGLNLLGITDVKSINSNRDMVEDQVARDWYSQHQQSSFFVKNSLGELTVDPAKLERLGKIIEEGRTGSDKSAKFKEFFGLLGIDFNTKELEYISARLAMSLRIGKDFGMVFLKGGMLENIYNSYKNNETKIFEGNYGMQDEKSSMTKLATLYYDANPGRYNIAAAKTADGKSKYLYILPNYVESIKRMWNAGKTAFVTTSALAQPNASFWSKVKMLSSTFKLNYFNGIREQETGQDGKVRKNLTPKEQAVAMLLKHQENSKTGTYVLFTLSDKTTTIETTMTKEFFVDSKNAALGSSFDYVIKEGVIEYTSALKDKVYNTFAEPEISRILAAIKYGSEVKLENFDIASKLFYTIPALNSDESLDEFRADLYANMPIAQLKAKHATAVADVIMAQFSESVEDQITDFLDNGILIEQDGKFIFPTSINGFKPTDYINRLRETGAKGRNAARLFLMDMKLNYMNAQVKTIQFLRFDPMLAFKTYKGYNKAATFDTLTSAEKIRLVNTTWDEFSKRAAALIAPGSQGSWNWLEKDNKQYSSNNYTAVTLADTETEELGNITDAQEYTTTQEHIDMLHSEGKIPRDIWQSITDKIRKAGPGGYYELNKNELQYALTPTKPVHVNFMQEGGSQSGLNRIDYVKSSRYPLLPQHEAGSERDKLRQWMEMNNIQTVNFVSAKKLGRPVASVGVFDENGSFIAPTADQLAQASQTLSRDGLRTQQEIPHQKAEIRTVSQMNRTLFDQLLDNEFELKGQKMTGREGKALKEAVRSRLFDIEAAKLQEEIGDTNKSHVGLHKLLKNLIANDTTGSYSENDLKSLELNEQGFFKMSLEFQFNFRKYQSLINSLINKNVMLKVDGSSFVQVSGVGAKFTFSSLSEGVKNDIIWTDTYIKENNDVATLKYIRKSGKEVKAAQVIVSQYLRDSKGNLIDLTQYIKEVNGVKILDTTNFSEEMFQLIGTRIPNQSHPSMLPIEVVGFLPAYMENTMIIPDGVTKQMGSDFDVDKLYTYTSKIVKSQEEGGQPKYAALSYELGDTKDISNFSKEQLEQLYRDLHWMVLTNPAAYEKITKSVDTPEVKKKIEARELLLAKYDIQDNKGVNLPLDFATSIKRYEDNRSAKTGVGVFANLISAQADLQDKALRLGFVLDGKEEENPIPIRLSKGGKVIELVNFGLPGTSTSFLKNEHSISDVINMMFTEAVDNAKNQFLKEFNWEDKALSAVGVMSMLTDKSGNAAPINFMMDLTSQSVISTLFKMTDKKQDSFGEFDVNALGSSVRDLQKMIAKRLTDNNYLPGKIAEQYLEDEERDNVLDAETLNDMWLIGKANDLTGPKREEALEKIAKDLNYKSVNEMMGAYYTGQYDVLNLFARLEDIGRETMTILGSVYTYTKGIGANVFSTKQKLNQLNKLSGSANFLGISQLAGKVTKNEVSGKIELDAVGEIGNSIKNSLIVAQSMYGSLFPISSGKTLDTLVDKLLDGIGKSKDNLGRQSFENTYSEVFNGVKAYMYTMPELELFDNVKELRSTLINGDTSIGKRITDLKGSEQYSTNGFIKNIEAKKSYKGDIYTISMKAPFGTDINRDEILNGFYDLALSDKAEIRQLAKDLAMYPFATGDAGNIGKFIPIDYYLNDADFNKALQKMSSAFASNMASSATMNLLKDQIVQNDPETYSRKFFFSTSESAYGANDNPFKRLLRKQIGNASDLSKVNKMSFKLGDFMGDKKSDGIINSLKVPVSQEDKQDAKIRGIDPTSVEFKYPAYLTITDSFTSEFPGAEERKIKYIYKRISPAITEDGVAQYERLEVLGYNGIKEYDFNNPKLTSAIANNNVDEDIVDTENPAASIVPQEERTPTEETPADTINIYAGTGENAELSNFAKRTFKDQVDPPFSEVTKFDSVEQAFQFYKVYYTVKETEMFKGGDFTKKNYAIAKQILQTTDGATLKRLGKSFENFNSKEWDKDAANVMQSFIQKSFEQNPDAAAKLLATGDAVLTHTQDKTRWGTDFPKLLMEVRSDLRNGKNEIDKTDDLSDLEDLIEIPAQDITVDIAAGRFIVEESEGNIQAYYTTGTGERGKQVTTASLMNQISVAHQALKNPERVVSFKMGANIMSYFVNFQNEVFSLQPTGYGKQMKSKDVIKRALEQLGGQEELAPVITIEPTTEAVEEKEEQQDTRPRRNGKLVKIPEGSNPENEVIFEDKEYAYLMNDGQQEAFNFIKDKVTNLLAERKRITENDLSDKVMFTDPLTAKFNGLIPQAMWDNMIGLAGRGGVGKTTVIKAIIAAIEKGGNKYQRASVMYLAPTHTAATVLQESLGLNSEKANDGKVNTISSHLRKNQMVGDKLTMMNEEGYLMSLRFKPAFGKPDVIIVDESSMVGAQDIKDMITRLETDLKEKVINRMPVFIFMGDYRQLGPINESQNEFVNKGVISSTLLLNQDKSRELTQVMRSDDKTLHNIYDAVGSEIVDNIERTQNGQAPRVLSFDKYDTLTEKSTDKILVVDNVEGVIDDYTTYLVENNNPYGMFWVHYNRVENAKTVQLAEKIRKQYLEKGGYVKDSVSHRTFSKGDYVEFTGNLEIDTNEIEYSTEDQTIQQLLNEQKLIKTENATVMIGEGVIKPRARFKVLDITKSERVLGDFLSDRLSNKLSDRRAKIDVEQFLIYNRQNKLRGLNKVLDISVDFGKYNSKNKKQEGIVIKNMKTGQVYAEFDSFYSEFKDLQQELINLNSKATMPFVPSYIGSSHTAQGNSIKNVIVGDYNVKEARNNSQINQDDIFSSMYTALTRTSGTLTIIKPIMANIVNNQDVYKGALTDKNELFKPVKSIVPATEDVNVPVEEKESEEVIDAMKLLMEAQREQTIETATRDLFGTETTVTDYKGFLNRLYTKANPLNRQIISMIAKSGVIAPVTFVLDNKMTSKGTYSMKTKTITVNSLESMDSFDDVQSGTDLLHSTIMHELMHHLTVELLNAKPESLTPEQRKWVKALNNLFTDVQTKMLADSNHGPKLRQALENLSADVLMSAEDKSMYYGLSNINEFVSMLMTDKGFQEFMNNTEFNGEKSILDRFIDLLTSILTALGVQINEKGVLKEGVTSIIGLIQSRNQEGDLLKSVGTNNALAQEIERDFQNIIQVLNIKTEC